MSTKYSHGKLSLDRQNINRRTYYFLQNSSFWGWLSIDTDYSWIQDSEGDFQNLEFRNNPENFYPCIISPRAVARVLIMVVGWYLGLHAKGRYLGLHVKGQYLIIINLLKWNDSKGITQRLWYICNLAHFLSSADFFRIEPFLKILSGIPSKCKTVWIQIRPDIMTGLIWVQTVCKKYHQMTLVGKDLTSVDHGWWCWNQSLNNS